MFIQELFDLNGVECPDWLYGWAFDDGEYDWSKCDYVFERGIHKWFLFTILNRRVVVWDGSVCKLQVYSPGDERLLFERGVDERGEYMT